jgi:parvulin-like peptidyl-prolyl isomerase
MPRRFFAILAAALLVTSCASSNTLVTVNGTAITKDDVIALEPTYADPLGNFTGDDLRQNVANLIALKVALQSAETQYGAALDDAAVNERIANPPDRYASLLLPTGLSTAAMRQRAQATLVIDAVSPQLVSAVYGGWAGVLASRPDLVSLECIRHINVATEDEANDVLARLHNGEDFISLAGELSLDTTSQDGLLIGPTGDCLTAYSSVSEDVAKLAATAELNVPVGPVQLGSGYSVIRVEDRVTPSEEELAADPMAYLDMNVATSYFSTWVADQMRLADIEVSPVLGSWSDTALSITAPGR